MPALEASTAFHSVFLIAAGAFAIVVGWYLPLSWREFLWARKFGDDNDKRISQGVLFRNVGGVAGLAAFMVFGFAAIVTPSTRIVAAVPERPAKINVAKADFTPIQTHNSSNTSQSQRKPSSPESELMVLSAQVVPSPQRQASPVSSARPSPDTSPKPSPQPSPAPSPDPSPAPSPEPSPDTSPTPSPEPSPDTSPTPSPDPPSDSSSSAVEDRSHGNGKCGDHETGNGDPKCDDPPEQ